MKADVPTVRLLRRRTLRTEADSSHMKYSWVYSHAATVSKRWLGGLTLTLWLLEQAPDFAQKGLHLGGLRDECVRLDVVLLILRSGRIA